MILLLAHERPDGDVDTYHLKPGRRYHIGRGSGCEVRILDLKLSRKHAVVEYADGAWRFADIGSTNGCTVDDVLADEALSLDKGSVINLGQTTLRVADLVDPTAVPLYTKQPSEEFQPMDFTAAPAPVKIEPLTAIRSATPIDSLFDSTTPLPLAVQVPRPPSGRQPVIIEPTPAPEAAATVIADDRPFFITVLGTRIGPLTKLQARELKTRELKGLLKPEDLAAYPRA